MRVFFANYRKQISLILIALLTITLASFYMNNFSSWQKRIVTQNQKVVLNGKKVYLSKIKLTGITDSNYTARQYAFINLDEDSDEEVLVRYELQDTSKIVYIVIKQVEKLAYVKDIMITDNIFLKYDGTYILGEEEKVEYKLAIENDKLIFNKNAYKVKENEDKEKYYVKNEEVLKFKYNSYFNTAETKSYLVWYIF